MNQIDISYWEIDPHPPEDKVELFFKRVLEYLKYDNIELSLVLTNDERIAEYNKTYRQKDGPTDVLTFCQSEGEAFPGNNEAPRFLGDIMISLDTVKKHSIEFKVSVDEEIRRVIIHAILHLLGRTHETRESDEPMLIEQEKLLISIGENIL